jgi:hypothetical protein
MLSTFWVTVNSMGAKATAKIQNLNYAAINNYVDLKYLAEHPEEFKGVCVTTNGTVRYYASIYMFEDFWLQAQNDAKIPVVTRFAGLPDPPEGLFIEISGKIEYSNLEGGFYFLNATLWKTIQPTPLPSLSPTPPQPSPTPQPTNPPTTQPVTPPAESHPIPQQPNSGLTVPVEYGLIALAAIVAIATVSTYLFYRRKKQPKPF